MDSIFLNLVRGNRLNTQMGLQLDGGVPPRYAKNYNYVEVPVREAVGSDGTPTSKILRNQHVRLVPACEVTVKGYSSVLVKTNPSLQAVANCPTLLLLDVAEGEQPSFYATFRKDYDLADLTWLVRLYLLS